MRRSMNDKKRILVMDGQTPVAMLMTFLLTRAGFDVTASHNGSKGFELATEKQFDLIVLDVELPGMDSFEICRELKQRHISYQTPILFVSKRAGAQDRQKAFGLGAADFIGKPLDADSFLSRISWHLEAPAPAGFAA